MLFYLQTAKNFSSYAFQAVEVQKFCCKKFMEGEMSKQLKISKQQILEGAVAVLRQNIGLNARNIAAVLKCSTQPIYSAFKNMEELKTELQKYSAQIQKQKVLLYLGKKDMSAYKAYGMGFVRFAKDEKELFGFLYMQQQNNLFAGEQDALYDEIIMKMQQNGFSKKEAVQFHLDMSIYTYGLAVLQSLRGNISDKEVSQRLTTQFLALKNVYLKKGEN